MSHAAAVIWLNHKEKLLSNIIKAGDLPFLGLYTEQFGEKERRFLHDQLHDRRDAVQWYLQGLQRWPAVFATYLTLHVVEGYGQRGNREVYPYVEQAVTAGLRHLTTNDRERFWQSYRQACLKLGLAVFPHHASPHYMTDEYLHQTGVPLRYVPELARRMLNYAERLGLPDDDDPAAIRLWSQGLREQINSGLSKTVPQALAADDTGFYTRLFLRCIGRSTNLDPQASALERAMDQTLRGAGDQEQRVQGRQLAIPRVVWQDGELGVELPSGDEVSWTLMVDGNEQHYQGWLESRFIALEGELPDAVEIRRNGERVGYHPLWEDERNNRLLIFTATGTLVTGAALGRREPLILAPGHYQVLLRFSPADLEDELEALSDEPVLYGWELDLVPGESHCLRRGPAELTLGAEARPLLAWRGDGIRDLSGHEFHASRGLGLRVVIPPEWLAQQAGFVLRLDPGGLGQAVEVSVPADEAVDYTLDLAPYCDAWRPGVGRLLAELRPAGTGRAVTRVAIVLWNGLERVEERVRFICSRLPGADSLDPDLSDNVRIDQRRRLLTYEDETRRLFRLVFNTGRHRQITFTGSVPGVFLTLREHHPEGVVERPLRKAGVLAVDLYSRQVLEIRSTGNGRLSGIIERELDFSRSGSIRLPLAGLADRLGSESNGLYFQAEGSTVPELLLKLVVPHQAVSFNGTRNLMGCYRVHLRTVAAVEALRLRTHNLLTGEQEEIVAEVESAEDHSDREGRAILYREEGNNPLHRYNLYLFPAGWPDGAWLLELDSRINGRWGSLCDDRQEPRRIGLLCRNGKLLGDPANLLGSLEELGEGRRLALFAEVHRALLPCRARRALQFMPWAEPLWQQLAVGLESGDGQTLRLLLQLASLEAENVGEGQGPLLSITARFPWIFARPGHSYHPLERGSGTLPDCLRVMAIEGDSLTARFQEGQFGVGFLFGFGNARAVVQQGTEPQGFDLSHYRTALLSRDLPENRRYLHQEDWRPGWGQYLGTLHYRYALKRLRERYLDCQAAQEPHLGNTLFLAQRLAGCDISHLGRGWPAHLHLGPRHLGLLSETNGEETDQENENLERLVQLLSLVAQVCRWEVRDRGALLRLGSLMDTYFDNPREAQQALGCLLYLGEDLFAFYLLLWELVIVAEKHELLECTING